VAVLSAESVILSGRRFTEALMTSTCVIRRAGERVLSETTGQYESSFTDVYTGPCKVKFGGTQADPVDAQSQRLVEQDAILSLPVVGSGDVTVDDVAEIVTSPMDAELVGLRFRVTGIHAQSFATARRFPVEVVTDAGSE
jgi:hypothetical protein